MLQNKTIRIVWQTPRRIDIEILALEGLRVMHAASAVLKSLLNIELIYFFCNLKYFESYTLK